MKLSAFLFLAAIAQLHSAPGEYPLLEQAQGYWELDPSETEDVGEFRCDSTPLQIIIDAQALRYVSIAGQFRNEAKILSVEGDRFWIRYDDEKRLDDTGKPVEWAWVPAGPKHFYWVRHDWLQNNPTGRTAMRRRCPQPEPTS